MTSKTFFRAWAVVALLSTNVSADTTRVTILGDSQISFGAGAAYVAFFRKLGRQCPDIPRPFKRAQTTAIGVRSTSLHHWTSPTDRAAICDIDKKYGVNAGVYTNASPDPTFVQIGQDPAYPFCSKNRTSLQAVFDTPRDRPDLLVLTFLGNAIDRWQSERLARADWDATAGQIPTDTACIVMTTIPSYEAPTNAKRLSAQSNLQAAVKATPRCAFVPGLTDRTIAAFEGNNKHFRTDASGRVTDPGHPSEASSAQFVRLQKPALCAALAQILTN